MNKQFPDAITEFIFIEHLPCKADVIFIPGNGYPQMAERAANLWKQGFSSVILPTGKHSILSEKFEGVREKREVYSGKYRTEWEFLQDVLQKNGVDRRCILKEEEASYTYENAIKSKEVTDKEGILVKKGIICCASFHARRCLLYYQLLYPDAQLFVCPSNAAGISKENWYKSERGINTVLGEMEKIANQFSDSS